MKAAVLHAANEPLTIEDVTLQKPRAREVLVRTAFAGLCHSDLHFIGDSIPIRCRPCRGMRLPAWWKPSAPMSPIFRPATT